MNFLKRSFEVTELGYIEVRISYGDYMRIADKINEAKILTSTRTRPPLNSNNEIDYIIPDWVYALRDEIALCVDSLTGETQEYLLDLDGNELISRLTCLDRSVSLWYDILNKAEDSYKTLIYEDELNPLHIKSILPLCTSLELTLQHIDLQFFLDNIWKPIQK
jgi:hypothetical protein